MEYEAYQATAEHEATHWWFLSRRELCLLQVRRAATELGFPQQSLTLLDYGCGTGFNLSFLAEYGQVYGAELIAMVPAPYWKAADFPLLDLAHDNTPYHGRFDIVTAFDVLEHIRDDVEGLRQIGRFLRPGGQLILTVPAYQWLWSGEDVVGCHVRRYTRATLLACCRAAAYEVCYLSYFNLMVLPAMALIIAIKKRFFPEQRQRSNLGHVPKPVNSLLHRLTSWEAHWVGRQQGVLPAGSSLVCRLQLKRGSLPYG
jgi:SAM-dependent methyltransferase